MSRIHAHRLIDAVKVSENLLPVGNIPVAESVLRPLASLSAEQQREVWAEAVATAPEGKVTAAQD